jgi:hypothetical protein
VTPQRQRYHSAMSVGRTTHWVKKVHIAMQHPNALGKGKVRMRFRGVHVEYVVEPRLVKLADCGVDLHIRTVLSLRRSDSIGTGCL